MLEITSENFEKEVLNSEKPVLVDFWAPWCAPCKIIAPTIEALAKELVGKVRIGKADVDSNPDLANHLSVLNIPTLILFKNGKEVSRMIGVNSKEVIESKVKALVD